MESKESEKNSGVTIANIVSVVGLVLLLVFSFFGHTYKSGGELAWDVLIPIGITAVIGFLLWFLIKAKGAENDLMRWRILEGIAFVVYLIMIWVSVQQSGVVHFFNAYADRNKIKNYAEADLGKIEALFAEYENFEDNALITTQDGLKNAVKHRRYDGELSSFMFDNSIESSETSVNEYVKFYERELLGSKYLSYKNEFDHGKQEVENAVKKWVILSIGMEAGRTVELKDSVEARLTRLSHNAKLPVIHKYADGYSYGLGGMQEREYRVTDGLQFKKALQDAGKFNIKALGIVVVIHLLILFSYFVAYRTKTLGPKTDLEYDGGITL